MVRVFLHIPNKTPCLEAAVDRDFKIKLVMRLCKVTTTRNMFTTEVNQFHNQVI